jgi:EF hand
VHYVAKLLILAGCLAVAASLSPAQPPKGKQGDKGAKGGLSDEALVNDIVSRLMAFDKNMDGKLTRDEITDTRLLRLFDKADTNKDGVVTRDQVVTLAKQMVAESAAEGGGKGGPGGPGKFGPPDKDGKGKGPPGKGGFGGPGGGPGGPGPGGAPKQSSPITEIMDKLNKGPQSLTELLDTALNADPTPWDTVQPQTKMFAKLAADLAKYDPPKGSKESWAKQTAAYADFAATLDRAAQAKDKTVVVAVHEKLSNSCMACHQQHKGGPGGPGEGFGGPGKFGPPDKGGKGKGPGGKGGPPGQILPPFLQDMLQLTAEQKQQVDALQTEVNAKLVKILTDDQNLQLKQVQQGGPKK